MNLPGFSGYSLPQLPPFCSINLIKQNRVRLGSGMPLPPPPDVLALEVLWKTVSDLRNLGRTEGIKILLTMVPPWPSREGNQARQGLLEAKLPVFEAQIRRWAAFPKAALAGVPVYKVRDPRAWLGWKDYVRVGEEVVSAL